MALAPIPPITSIAQAGTVGPAGPTSGAGSAGSSIGTSFGDALATAFDDLSASQARAGDLAVQAATGDLSAVHDYTIAASEAQLLTQLTVEVRNRAVEAFNDIMRMPV